MMTTFENWYSKLIEDSLWYELLRAYKDETIKKAGEKVYAQLVAEGTVSYRPMSENRKHVYNIVCKNPGDKVNSKSWYQSEQQKKEAEKAKEWVPVTEDVRQKKLAELKALVDSLPMLNNFPRTTRTEEVENCDWIPKREKIEPRSEVQVLQVINEHAEKVRTARRKYFLDAYPDASEEEIEAYLKKFDVI